METLKVFLFFTPFFIPLFFQILFGSGFIPVCRKMKFGLVCVISFVLLFVTYFIYAKMLSHNMAKNEIKDGLPFAALFMIESVMAIAVTLTILIQILVKYLKNRKKS